MKEDNYITLLRWGRDQPEGILTARFKEKLKELNFPDEGQYANEFLNSFTKDAFSNIGNKNYLSFNGYFQLSEHERLEEAREESKEATKLAVRSLKVATYSLWATIATIIISIIIELCKN